MAVRLILSDPFLDSQSPSEEENATISSYVCTFKVFPGTKFSELKRAACLFWGKLEEKYLLTDVCFHNLAAIYADTVTHFFKNAHSSH